MVVVQTSVRFSRATANAVAWLIARLNGCRAVREPKWTQTRVLEAAILAYQAAVRRGEIKRGSGAPGSTPGPPLEGGDAHEQPG